MKQYRIGKINVDSYVGTTVEEYAKIIHHDAELMYSFEAMHNDEVSEEDKIQHWKNMLNNFVTVLRTL